jgi:aldehyde:ferredoxin oxidoreductase
MEDLGIGPMDRFQEEGRAAVMVRHQDWRSAGDALICCQLVNVPSDGLVSMLAAATGWELTREDLFLAGERILNLKRALNLRWGWDRRDEKLPGLFRQPLDEGGTNRYVPDVDRLLSDYYEARQWDRTTGKPTKQKLVQLGLNEVVAELY